MGDYIAGPRPVLGHEPGNAFQADLPADQEKRLLASGAITVAAKPATSRPQRDAAASTPPAAATASGSDKNKE